MAEATASALLRLGRHHEALETASQAMRLNPDNPRVHATVGWACFGLDRIDEGLAALEHAVALSPGDTMWLAQLGQANARAGNTDKAAAILGELEELSRHRYVSPYHLAYVYTGLGQLDRAMDCLEHSYEQRAGAVYGIKGSFLFAPLRSHPRFEALLRRMHLA